LALLRPFNAIIIEQVGERRQLMFSSRWQFSYWWIAAA